MYQQKKDLIRDVLHPNASPAKVPLYLVLQGWIVYESLSSSYSEIVYDGNKVLAGFEKAINTFEADIYYNMGEFSSMFYSKCLGSEDYILNDKNYSMNFKDVSYLSSDEDYLNLAKSPRSFLWNTFYQKKFKNLTPEKIATTLHTYLSLANEHNKNSQVLKTALKEKKGSLFLSDVPMYQPAFDYLFQYIVGIKGISLDMRRNASKLMAALDSFEDLFNGFMTEMTPPLEKDAMPFQNQICLLGHTITNKKQFERFIWPHLSKKLDEYIEKDLKFYFMVQGSGNALLEFLDYIPEGMCALHVECDTIEDLKKRFGNKFTYVGGLPVSILGNASISECKKYTESILEKYAHDGNFIFSTDKGIICKNDATVDNLKMVCDTVNNFKV